MTVYLDIVFFENVILNYIILMSTAIISNSRTSIFRIMLTSLIGSFFSIVNYIIELKLIINLVFKIFLSVIMIVIAFNNFNLKIFVKQLLFFYIVSFFIGGITFMLIFLISSENVRIIKNHFVGIYPMKMTFVAGIVGFLIVSVISKISFRKISSNTIFGEIEIFYNGNKKKIKAMLDTGNLLKEPITDADVIVVEKNSLIELIEKNEMEKINLFYSGFFIENDQILKYKFKLIPFASLGNNTGLMLGFKPDIVKIYTDEKIVRNDVLIGVYDGRLTNNGSYTSLIGLNIIDSSKGLKI